jgi:hypothetical protein
LTIGLEMVTNQQVETCIFGPSVKPEKIQEFITNAHLFGKSTQCAFLVFQQRDRREDVAGAHAILEFPCTRPLFNAGIVKALAEANGGSLPVSRRNDPTTGQPILLKEQLRKLDFPGHPAKVSKETDKSHIPTKPWSRELIQVAVERYPRLYTHLVELHPFNLKFRADGSPSEFTSGKIQEVIADTFAETDDIADMPRFKGTLEKLLQNWLKRGSSQGRATADFLLKKELRQCLSANGQTRGDQNS